MEPQWILSLLTPKTFSLEILLSGFVSLLSTYSFLSSNPSLLPFQSQRNTEWVIGIVLYAGHETKAMLNTRRAPSKASFLEKEMNKMVLWTLALLIVICLICGAGTFRISLLFSFVSIPNSFMFLF